MDEEIKPPTTGDPARCAAPAGSAPTYDEVMHALDRLHIVCECAQPNVYDWYLRQPHAKRARATAIDILNRHEAFKRAQNRINHPSIQHAPAHFPQTRRLIPSPQTPHAMIDIPQLEKTIRDASITIDAVDRLIPQMLTLCKWRLRVASRHYHDRQTLAALKRELASFNIQTGCWKP